LAAEQGKRFANIKIKCLISTAKHELCKKAFHIDDEGTAFFVFYVCGLAGGGSSKKYIHKSEHNDGFKQSICESLPRAQKSNHHVP